MDFKYISWKVQNFVLSFLHSNIYSKFKVEADFNLFMQTFRKPLSKFQNLFEILNKALLKVSKNPTFFSKQQDFRSNENIHNNYSSLFAISFALKRHLLNFKKSRQQRIFSYIQR